MATELESYKSLAKEIETQMGLLEQKVTSIAAVVSRLRTENQDLAHERDELADTVRSLEERVSGIDLEGADRRIKDLMEENELLQAERQAVAPRIGELLDKLDHLSA